MGRLVFFLSFLLAAVTTRAEHDVACDRLNLQHLDVSAKRLSAIAKTCVRPELARLFYQRAYMRELLDEHETFNQMISTDRNSHASFEGYRVLIGLAEAFAADALSRGDAATLTRLSRTYDRYIEITELRLKGYDLIADRMERELRF